MSPANAMPRCANRFMLDSTESTPRPMERLPSLAGLPFGAGCNAMTTPGVSTIARLVAVACSQGKAEALCVEVDRALHVGDDYRYHALIEARLG